MLPLESIDYTVRVSQRAKHVNLRLTRTGQLEVVIPPGFDRAEIPSIIAKHGTWLERAIHPGPGDPDSDE
jgi:predicted metal-dependent hydrolase